MPTQIDAATIAPAKLTLKQEAFALAYVATGNASEAYRRSYVVSPTTKVETVNEMACRVLADHKVTARVEALKAASAQRHQITVEKLTAMALEAFSKAKEAPTPQTSAMVKAAEFLGKLHGLAIERKETGKPGDFSRMTDEDLENVIRGAEGSGEGAVGPAQGARVTH